VVVQRINAAREFLRLGDLDSARAIADREMEAAATRDGSARDVWAYRLVLLEIERLRGHTEEALNKLHRLEQMDPPPQEDSESRIGIIRIRGYYFGLLGRYEISCQLLQEAEAMARDLDLLELRTEVQLCQAMISYLQEKYSISSNIFHAVLALSNQIKGWYFNGVARWGIGKNLMIENHYQPAIPWLEDAVAIFEGVGSNSLAAVAFSELAVCHLGLGNDVLALDLLRKAECVQHKAGSIGNYQVVLANIGNVYLYRGDHLTAISYYRQALSLARQIKDPVSIRKWTYNINLAYLRMRSAIDG